MTIQDIQTDTARERDESLAYLLLRATLGTNILIHGVARILSGPGQFASVLAHGFHSTVLPQAAVVGFAYALP
jgi:thiosulfate dehydrogenase (quinone) large subunit